MEWVYYRLDREFVRFRDSAGYVKGKLLDIGCGGKPYLDFGKKL